MSGSLAVTSLLGFVQELRPQTLGRTTSAGITIGQSLRTEIRNVTNLVLIAPPVVIVVVNQIAASACLGVVR